MVEVRVTVTVNIPLFFDTGVNIDVIPGSINSLGAKESKDFWIQATGPSEEVARELLIRTLKEIAEELVK